MLARYAYGVCFYGFGRELWEGPVLAISFTQLLNSHKYQSIVNLCCM